MATMRKKSRKNDPSYSKRRSTAPDTQRIIPIQSVTPASTLKLASVDRILSGYNHRLYRQHGSYRVKIDLLDGADTGEIKVYALANTWYVKRAIQMAKQVHDQAMEEERAMTPGARWYDFRIDDNTGSTGGFDQMVFATVLTPGAPPAPVTHPGEYAPSIISDSAGASKEFRVLGASSASGWNIFSEYDALGNTMANPDVDLPSGSGYDGADATVDGSNIESLNNRGNIPPYDRSDLEDRVFVQVGSLYRSPGGNQRLSTGFFDAPLGMVWITQPTADGTPLLEMEVKAGNYKGVHMEAY
jgi:hypothetical protein